MPKKSSQIFLIDHPEDGKVLDTRHPNTKEEQAEVKYITDHLNRMYDQTLNQRYHEFGERTLAEYVDDSEKRINSYVVPRGEDVEDWQTNGFEGVTREKMFAFVSKVAMDVPKYKYKAVRDDDFVDMTVSDICGTFFRHSWWTEDPIGIKFMEDAWAIAGAGTGITFEGIEQEENEVYDFESYDPLTGEMTGLTIESKKSPVTCMQRRVHPARFLFDNMYGGRDVQKQVRIAEVQTFTHDEFLNVYGGFYKANMVPRTHKRAVELFRDSFHQEQWNILREQDEVHVVHYFTKERGKSLYRIIANGVLILSTPNPRKDGLYPYGVTIFRPFGDSSFVCGKSLPDEIAHDQDIYNALKNSMMDRAILYTNRPMISDKPNELLDEVWGPNRILNVKGDKVTTLDIKPPDGNDIGVLQELRGAMNRQTSDQQQSGQSGSGSTAREIVIADEHSRKLMGVVRKYLEYGHWQSAKLRMGNIVQYFFDPVYAEDTLNDEQMDAFKIVYRKISLEGERLADGKTGTRSVEIVPTRQDLAKPVFDEATGEQIGNENDVEEEMARMQGFELEKLQVTSDYLRRFQRVDMMLIPESSYLQSKSIGQALELEYQKTAATLYPDKFQEFKDIFFGKFNEVYDRDISEFDRVNKEKKPEPALVSPDGQPIQPGSAPGAGAPRGIAQQLGASTAPIDALKTILG